MWALARRYSGTDASDMVQEALEQAWRTQRSFDPTRGSRRTWLLMLVADRCRKRHRRYRPATVVLVDHPADGVDMDRHLDLSRAVAQLPRRQRLAVELHYVLGLTVVETAVAMRCSGGTVKSTLSDARTRLRSALRETP